MFVAAVLVVAALAVSSGVAASSSPVSLGRITARASQGPELKRELESSVKRELGLVDLSSVRGRERYVLSATLVKIETVTASDQVETSCVVSATLTRAGSGALHAVLQGRARATDGRDAAKSAEVAALRAAVQSAIKRVPEAIR